MFRDILFDDVKNAVISLFDVTTWHSEILTISDPGSFSLDDRNDKECVAVTRSLDNGSYLHI